MPIPTVAEGDHVAKELVRVRERYRAVRDFTQQLVAPLEPEDCVIQSMPDVSPTRWHLAHTTWFFETFALAAAKPDYQAYHPAYEVLFNSYYNTVGEQFPRPRRGLLSRPTVAQVLDYRRVIDERVLDLLDRCAADPNRVFASSTNASDSNLAATDWLAIIELGCQHEQQHQELMLTDIKHVLSCNPLYPAYRTSNSLELDAGQSGDNGELAGDNGELAGDLVGDGDGWQRAVEPSAWREFPEGLREIGWAGEDSTEFAFDNERPRHRVFLERFELADRLATNAEFLRFIESGGYREPRWWLSEGWAWVQAERRGHPLYWVQREDGWYEFCLNGLRPLLPAAPVCHLSYFEAEAFARWSGARLPTEAEWEVAAAEVEMAGNFVESGHLHPCPAPSRQDGTPARLHGLFGDVWEWTASPYVGYPGYAPVEGALGEYNGKFMCNQFVLRGGSCATSRTHIRRTYRNFFPPAAQWQFTGVRLAR